MAVVRVTIVARTAPVKRVVCEDFEKRKKNLILSRVSGQPPGDLTLFETVLVTVGRVTGLLRFRKGAPSYF